MYCEKIANTISDYHELLNDTEFLEDWEMIHLIMIAKETVGELMDGEKYCLKLPGVLGGKYNSENIGKITQFEQISISGNLAKQILDLPDGTEIKIEIK